MSKQAFDQIAEGLREALVPGFGLAYTRGEGTPLTPDRKYGVLGGVDESGGYSITIGGIAIRPWEIESITGTFHVNIIMRDGAVIIIDGNTAQANGYPDIHALRSQLAAMIVQSPETVR